MPREPMPSLLEPSHVQILFADLQPSIVARSRTNPPEALVRSAGVLAEVGRLLGLPLHFSVVPDAGEKPELIPELARQAKATELLPRMSANPFLDLATSQSLAATSRGVLVICGFATEVVVLHAARTALELGHRVIIPVDACGGMSARTEDATFRQVEAAGAVTASVAGVVTAMAPDFSSAPGHQAFEILQTLRIP